MENNYLLAGSEALSEEFNNLADVYSDFHKDVYGFRPRVMAMCACDYADEASLQEALSHLRRLMDGLEAYAPTVFAREEELTQQAIASFEKEVVSALTLGASDRAAAIRWICEANGVKNAPGTYGWEHLEYLLGIPYGYIEGKPNKYG